MKKILFLLLLCCGLLILVTQPLIAQGLKGKVLDSKSKPVGFVTIYCKDLKKGSNSNEDGSFELPLTSGQHQVVFQCVGYKTQTIEVSVAGSWVQQDIVLAEQSYELKEVSIKDGGVNPAVWIMRKAIAAAPYYRRQVLVYDARVYVKGSGKLEEIPFLMEKMLKDEGIREGQTFLVESINEVNFKQPNTFKEKSISIKSSFPSDGGPPQPLSMIRGSLYQTSNTELISPLSPQAFSVYNFKLEGSFYENGREVNKIKVTPKRKGQDVFEGYIYIMEGLWCIYSTDLTTKGGGFESRIVASCGPVPGYDYVWMPVTYDISVKGGFLGFKGNFKYLASVSDYRIKLNPNVDHNWVKRFSKEAPPMPKEEEPIRKALTEPVKPKTKRQQDIEKLMAKEELTKLEMLKLANKMRAEAEAEQRKSPEIATDSSTMEIDSLADKRDSSFWAGNRPVALMESEVVSYKQFDSVQLVKAKDTSLVKKNGSDSGFYWMGLVFGDGGTFAKKKFFYSYSGLIGEGAQQFVNTVDGFGAGVQWRIGSMPRNGKNWIFTNTIRVPFERPAFNTIGNLRLNTNPGKLSYTSIEGGVFVRDFNPTGGPTPFVNSYILLLDKRNLSKLYQEEYGKVTYQRELSNGLIWKSDATWSNRYQLSNIDRYRRKEGGKITANTPLPGYQMPTHQALVLTQTFTYTPFQRYKMEGAKKVYVDNRWPTLELAVKNGIPTLLQSDVDYMSLTVGLTERIRPLHWLKIQARFSYQQFVYNNSAYFPDWLHANGNRSPLLTGDPIYMFRQLDYYQPSNTRSLIALHGEFEFKRFVFKRLPLLNMLDLREVLFYNRLDLPGKSSYQEIGYGLDRIIGFIRVDAFAGFTSNVYSNWGVRAVITINGLN